MTVAVSEILVVFAGRHLLQDLLHDGVREVGAVELFCQPVRVDMVSVDLMILIDSTVEPGPETLQCFPKSRNVVSVFDKNEIFKIVSLGFVDLVKKLRNLGIGIGEKEMVVN